MINIRFKAIAVIVLHLLLPHNSFNTQQDLNIETVELINNSDTRSSGAIDNFWTNPSTWFLYAPGIFCAEDTICRYGDRYLATTGEWVFGNKNFQTINGSMARGCNFAEIVLTDVEKLHAAQESNSAKSLFENMLYKFANFFLQKKRNAPFNIIIEGSSKTGYTLNPYFIDLAKMNFGQERDIKILSDNYDICCQKKLSNEIVAYGNSRGAATVFDFIATEYAQKSEKCIKAVVLEGCFDAVRYVTWLNPILSLLPSYSAYGIAPINDFLIQQFVEVCTRYEIPVLCITSLRDEIVPSDNTKNLCNALKNAGLENFYLLELQRSRHSFYMLDDEEDIRRYLSVVHAFYRYYNLSYNEALAQEGLEELDRCRIS